MTKTGSSPSSGCALFSPPPVSSGSASSEILIVRFVRALRVESYREMSAGFTQQVEDQKAQVENLKAALRKLEQKLAEANTKADLLIAQHRRARAASRANDAHSGMSANAKSATFDRMKRKVAREEAVGQAKAELLADDVDDRIAALEKEDRIEQLLTELKTKRGA